MQSYKSNNEKEQRQGPTNFTKDEAGSANSIAASAIAGGKSRLYSNQQGITNKRSLTPANIISLQRTIGNRAVTGLIAKAKRERTDSSVVPANNPQTSLQSNKVIQRVELKNIPLTKKELKKEEEAIDHNKLASINYSLLSKEALIELMNEVYNLLGDKADKIDSFKKDQLTEEELALGKAKKSIESFLTGKLDFITGFQNVAALALGLDYYVIESNTYTASELAVALDVNESVIKKLSEKHYPDVKVLLNEIKELTGKELKGFPQALLGEQGLEFPKLFERELDKPFFKKLKDFRKSKNTAPNYKFKGGEGQIYLSNSLPEACLKRWYKTRIKDLDKSVELLKKAYEAVEKNLELKEYIEVVKVHERGPDWIIRDFDLDSESIQKTDAGNTFKEKVLKLLSGYEKTSSNKGKELTLEDVLLEIKFKVKNTSDNIHWSKTRKKLLVIDLM